jgi:hypothetical protein
MVSDRGQNGKFLKGNTAGFKAGVSGNPGGRPRDYAISEALRVELAQIVGAGFSLAEAIAKKLVHMAVAGELGAIREILDRMEGKPRQAIDMHLEVTDWRERARLEGLSEADVICEARALIESYDADGGGGGDPEETEPGGYKS